jgi:hypothetical protein
MDVEKLYQGKGGYVFVSHSHLDIENVREIRNYLEGKGMEPILFYLRCMDGGDEEQLEALKKLIFDEIDAREFFLYVNSENAAASKWVQDELAHIRATRPHCIASVDLGGDRAANTETLSRLVRGMRIFISASRRDRAVVQRLNDALIAHDFRVYDVEAGLSVGDSWAAQTERTISDLANEGFVIALVTESSLRSEFFLRELSMAISEGVPILPVVVDNAPLMFLADKLPHLGGLQCVTLSAEPTDGEIDLLVQAAMDMKKRVSDSE